MDFFDIPTHKYVDFVLVSININYFILLCVNVSFFVLMFIQIQVSDESQ